VERLELLVVQLEEAKRLIQVDRAPQLRLAFILLDNTAEVILYLTARALILHQEVLARDLAYWRRVEAAGHKDATVEAEIRSLESQVLSKRELSDIDRTFDKNVDFLTELDLLDGVLGYKGVDDAVEIANNSAYGLAGGVYTGDLALGYEVAGRIRSGTIEVNTGWTSGYTPMGGVRGSGYGRERGVAGVREYQVAKHVVVGGR